ncbi:MAG: 50S ribosomal protein L16 3-hydroxylase [Gammaproteobacteria bacterium]|nr:50S ribosomal protein L16 3-hydroxylase [Gammaproteobacteria bacterium]
MTARSSASRRAAPAAAPDAPRPPRARSPRPASLLGGLRIDAFLRRHWQKKPLLVRRAMPGLRPLLTAEELAGLACEEDVSSRLVIEKGGTRPWQVIHGPLSASDFRRLPRSHWTLLVTDVDKIVRAAGDLLEHFDFIPGWRVDDLMVSYAADRGSVGPHVDSYDVFLLQAGGRRRWKLSDRRHGAEDFVPGLDLRILGDFHASQEWLLEPGDMLYLPPGVAHYGIAEGSCMTYSVGFRAPSQRDLVSAYADYVATTLDPETRYVDPDLRLQSASGEIGAGARRRFRRMVRALARGEAGVDDWLGRYLTESGPWRPAQPPRRPLTPARFSARWARRGTLLRSDRCRFAHIRQGRACTLYTDGHAFALPGSLAFAGALLSGRRRFPYEEFARARQRPGFLQLLCELHNKGYLHFP